MKIPKHILTILTFGLLACNTAKNIPGKLHYRNEAMYEQAKPLRLTDKPYGFFLFPDSSQALFIPKGKKYPVMMFYRIDDDFIYIP